MTMQNYDQLIDKLAAKLAVPATHLWAVLLLQVRVDLIESALGLCVGLAVLVALALNFRRIKAACWEDDIDMYSPVLILPLAVAVLAVAVVVCDAENVIGRAVNPEYYALQAIVGAVK